MIFITLNDALSTFFNVTRVITLAPPMTFTPTTQLSGGIFLREVIPKSNRHFMPWASWVKPRGLPYTPLYSIVSPT